MKSLVEKILDVSREQIYTEKVKSRFSITEVIEDVIEEFEFHLKKRDLTITKKLEEIYIHASLEDMDQIIRNLVNNSIKYTNGKVININLYNETDSVVFNINNECNEFPDEIKDRLLEPFVKYNVYEDISKEVSSSGLGLYLCKELAGENNSELSYKIEDGIITFTLKINMD